MSTQTMDSTNTLQERSMPVKGQYTLGQIIGIWLVGGAPIWVWSWIVAPALIPFSPFHPAITYWLFMIAGMAWQFVFSLAIVYGELGTLRWSAICERTWLRLPRDPKMGQPNPKLFWWLLPMIIVYALVGLGLSQYLDAPVAWLFPNLHPAAYQDTSQLAMLDLKGQWWLLGIASASALFNYFLGEEFLFRGVLLPKMEGAFGKYDWLANAVFFGLYHLHKPWGIPTNILQALALTLPARHFRSNWMPIAVHATEGLLMLITILVIILGAAPG